MLGGFPAKYFQPIRRLLNRYPITRMIPVVIVIICSRSNRVTTQFATTTKAENQIYGQAWAVSLNRRRGASYLQTTKNVPRTFATSSPFSIPNLISVWFIIASCITGIILSSILFKGWWSAIAEPGFPVDFCTCVVRACVRPSISPSLNLYI